MWASSTTHLFHGILRDHPPFLPLVFEVKSHLKLGKQQPYLLSKWNIPEDQLTTLPTPLLTYWVTKEWFMPRTGCVCVAGL